MLLLASSAHAYIASMTITPPNPTDEDAVSLSVAGWLPDSCWSLGDYSVTVGPFSILVDIDSIDEWLPGLVCLQYVIPYGFVWEFGALAPGHYVVTVRETRYSLREPGVDTATVEFDVTDSTPVEPESWGRIKGLYAPKR